MNGNFGADGGSFDDWTISHTPGNTNYANYSPMIYEGGSSDPAGDPYYARFLNEESGSADILSQDISTIPGDIYIVSFYAEDGSGNNFTTDFSFGNFMDNLGNTFSIGPGEWLKGWTNFDFTVAATQAETDLSFLVNANNGSEFGVTGVSVTGVPQLQEFLEAGKFYVTVTNSNAQVIIQASTNLMNWVNVCTNMAPYTFTNMCDVPQRFFRAALVSQAAP